MSDSFVVEKDQEYSKWGYGTTKSFISIGDPYVDGYKKQLTRGTAPTEKTKKEHRVEFKTNPPKRGKGPDATISDFKSINVSSDGFHAEYKDQYLVQREIQAEDRKKLEKKATFKFPNPPKKSTGAGSDFGCLSAHYEHLPEAPEKSAKRKDEKEKRQFVHSVPKKGSGGVPGTVLNPLPPREGEEPYIDGWRLQTMKRSSAKSTFSQPHPMKAGRPKNDFFDPNPYGVDESKIPKSSKPKAEAKKEKPKKQMYSNPKSNVLETFPEHQTDEYERVEQVKREMYSTSKPLKKGGVQKKDFCYVSHGHTIPSRSVMFGRSTRGRK
ncbi:Protein of unknown function DUF4586 like protein [Aduncisulcus paluster]|uniref:Cilia-and flagella-associated protein 96 n=1 Tax=Aduncisulcus paluster TaxID=2918883 RepID=A0ABQ5KTF1_9EUKA|nr:Protein of unknown function DUF4586 like protein [Aduncisulcus paluster]